MTHAQRREIEQGIEAAIDKLEEAKVALDEVPYDDDWADYEGDAPEPEYTVNDVALSTLVALATTMHVVKDLRGAGAEIEEVPIEDEALATCVVNSTLIHEDMQRDIAHLESLIERVRAK